MPYIEVDIDVDDFYDELTRWDKQSLAERLENDGFCTLDEDNNNDDDESFKRSNDESFDESQFKDNLTKLWDGFYQLPIEDIETIKKLANKL